MPKGFKGFQKEHIQFNNWKGKNHKEESKQKMSIAHKGKIGYFKGKKFSKEHRKHISEARKGIKFSEITKKKMSVNRKGKMPLNWHTLYTPEINQKRRVARLKQKLPTKDTSIELKVKKWLEKRKIKYVQQFNLGNKFQCDFYLPLSNLIVECDGDYWHSREDTKKRDKSKDAYAKKCGFKMLRLTESEINKGRFAFL